ncbi:MAG: N-acetylglucosamine kinase, partial [Aequorivita vladivostokensis]|nr:N-acetylglucosamine kinase [Aequorivita vladivostokensis]
MTLITDGGSTKCDWVLLDNSGNIVFKTATLGLNPAIVPKEELIARIVENQTLNDVFKSVEMLDFYGAGCGTATPRSILKEVLQGLFVKANVNVYEDMAAAVFATTTAPGIVCILGTGSNSCYFDGTEIHSPIPSLGFILMDEASGNYFGKRLIRDYYYKRMPPEVAEKFEEKFDLDSDTIKMNLYRKENPNTYLAHFAEFIFTNERNGYFYKLLHEGLTDFVHSRVLAYPQVTSV